MTPIFLVVPIPAHSTKALRGILTAYTERFVAAGIGLAYVADHVPRMTRAQLISCVTWADALAEHMGWHKGMTP